MIEISTNKADDLYEITVNGEVDASSSIHLDNALSQAVENGESKIMVDCNSLSYISSAGLGVFMSYLEDFKSNQTSFVIFGLSEKVRHVFELIGLENLFKIVLTKEEAINYLNDSQP